MYNATKSVPPVEALAFKAITACIPYRKPPNIIFNRRSSNTASKCITFRKKEAMITCNKEKKVNLLLILLQQNSAIGIFKTNIPREVENVKPK